MSRSSFPFVFESPFDDAICDAIGDVIGSPFDDAIDDAICDAIDDVIGDAICDVIGDAICDAIDDVIGDAIDDVTGDADESSSSIVQSRKLEIKQKISKMITTRYFYVISYCMLLSFLLIYFVLFVLDR